MVLDGLLSMHIYGAQPEVINKPSTQGIHSDVVAKNTISILAGYEASSSEPGRLDDVYSGSIHTLRRLFSSAQRFTFTRSNGRFLRRPATGAADGSSRRHQGGTADETLANEIGWAFVNDGVTTVLRDVCVEGSAIEQIHDLARAAGIACIMNSNTVTISPYNGITSSTPVEVSPETGLIGYPAFASGGIAANTLFNPAIKAGGKVSLSTFVPQANGQFNVHTVQHRISCDAPDGEWSTHFYANKEGLHLNGRGSLRPP